MLLMKPLKNSKVDVLGVDFWELTFWEVDILGVDILGVDILGVDILRLTPSQNGSPRSNTRGTLPPSLN